MLSTQTQQPPSMLSDPYSTRWSILRWMGRGLSQFRANSHVFAMQTRYVVLIKLCLRECSSSLIIYLFFFKTLLSYSYVSCCVQLCVNCIRSLNFRLPKKPTSNLLIGLKYKLIQDHENRWIRSPRSLTARWSTAVLKMKLALCGHAPVQVE